MKTKHFWIDIIALGSVIAFAIALFLATLGAAAGAATSQDESTQTTLASATKTYRGMVTCSRCGAKHSASLGRSASDCVRICVHSGADFALIDGDKIYQLKGDVSMIKKVAGQRAEVIGVADGDTITVSSVSTSS